MPPNVQAPIDIHDNDDDMAMMDEPIDNPEWWKDHCHTPGEVAAAAVLQDRVAAAEQAGVPSAVATWATVDPTRLGEDPTPYSVSNIVNGQWTSSHQRMSIPNPMNKGKPDLFTIPDTAVPFTNL